MTLQSGHKQFQVDHYQSLANVFDVHFHRENRNHFNKIAAIHRFLDAPAGTRILEVGAGTGIHAKYFLEANAGKNVRFTATDLSFHMLLECRKRLAGFAGVTFARNDGENLPFPDAAFDAVYISGSLHHFENLEKGVAEIVRVVKPGGRFCIMEPNWIFPSNYLPSKFMPSEKNIAQIRTKNFRKWFARHPETRTTVHYFAYTPPFPRLFHGLYDLVDTWMNKIPLLRRMSVMLFVTGEKAAKP